MPRFLSSTTGLRALALLAIAFGALTIKEGGAVLFSQDAARVAAGDYVPFVLWSNFLLGFVYVASGLGLWFRRRWGEFHHLSSFSHALSSKDSRAASGPKGGRLEETRPHRRPRLASRY